MKIDPQETGTNIKEEDFDLAYYRSLSTTQRFRMMLDWSLALGKIGTRRGTARKPASVTKRL